MWPRDGPNASPSCIGERCRSWLPSNVRTLFPFPILGIDTDNGGEFINELLIAYCEHEQMTFTRGRPSLKNDQCFVDQKNGAIVRKAGGL
jgi:hypothetical protein